MNLFPFSWTLALARPVGIFLFWILKKHRRIALENLRRAYEKEKSEAEIQQIARESFVYLVEFGIEWLRMPELAKRPHRYFEIRNVEKIHSALEKKRGVLILVSHAGHWEIMALIGGLLLAQPVGASIYALARPLKNHYLYHYALRLRGLTGLRSITKSGAVRETLIRLKENAIVCLLIDQRVSEGGVTTEFFGRPALTTSLPALAAHRLKTPVFFVSLERTKDLRYVMDVKGPFPIEETQNAKQDIQVNTQRFNDLLEAEIRKNPGRWLWMHKRWRLLNEPKD